MFRHLRKHKRYYIIGSITSIILRAWGTYHYYIIGSITSIILRAWGAYHYVETTSEPLIYQSVDEVPQDQTILLLGTTPTLADGEGNPFYIYRIDAVVQLWQSDVISHILISGDNRHAHYNETEAMMQSLIDRGVPADIIELDHAGFRTLDSIVRAHDVFGLDDILVVSQTFHVERAITIARQKGIAIHGFAAQDVSTDIAPRVYIREILARMWMTLDLFLLHTKPHFPS